MSDISLGKQIYRAYRNDDNLCHHLLSCRLSVLARVLLLCHLCHAGFARFSYPESPKPAHLPKLSVVVAAVTRRIPSRRWPASCWPRTIRSWRTFWSMIVPVMIPARLSTGWPARIRVSARYILNNYLPAGWARCMPITSVPGMPVANGCCLLMPISISTGGIVQGAGLCPGATGGSPVIVAPTGFPAPIGWMSGCAPSVCWCWSTPVLSRSVMMTARRQSESELSTWCDGGCSTSWAAWNGCAWKWGTTSVWGWW